MFEVNLPASFRYLQGYEKVICYTKVEHKVFIQVLLCHAASSVYLNNVWSPKTLCIFRHDSMYYNLLYFELNYIWHFTKTC